MKDPQCAYILHSWLCCTKGIQNDLCEACKLYSTKEMKKAVGSNHASNFPAIFDNSSMVYPSGPQSTAIRFLESSFPIHFSFNKLHEKALSTSLPSWERCICPPQLKEHAVGIIRYLMKFSFLSRFHYLTKLLNLIASLSWFVFCNKYMSIISQLHSRHLYRREPQ